MFEPNFQLPLPFSEILVRSSKKNAFSIFLNDPQLWYHPCPVHLPIQLLENQDLVQVKAGSWDALSRGKGGSRTGQVVVFCVYSPSMEQFHRKLTCVNGSCSGVILVSISYWFSDCWVQFNTSPKMLYYLLLAALLEFLVVFLKIRLYLTYFSHVMPSISTCDWDPYFSLAKRNVSGITVQRKSLAVLAQVVHTFGTRVEWTGLFWIDCFSMRSCCTIEIRF